MDSRRVKLLYLDANMVVRFFNADIGSRIDLPVYALPPDARAVACEVDFFRNSICLIIESNQFDPVPPNQIPSEIEKVFAGYIGFQRYDQTTIDAIEHNAKETAKQMLQNAWGFCTSLMQDVPKASIQLEQAKARSEFYNTNLGETLIPKEEGLEKLKALNDSVKCPNCQSLIQLSADFRHQLICPSCQTPLTYLPTVRELVRSSACLGEP